MSESSWLAGGGSVGDGFGDGGLGEAGAGWNTILSALVSMVLLTSAPMVASSGNSVSAAAWNAV